MVSPSAYWFAFVTLKENFVGNMDALKELALCQFDYLDATARATGLGHLLAMYEECVSQVLHHDIQVLCEQVSPLL